MAWFDGVADYVSIADHNDFTFIDGSGNDTAFSLSAWILVPELSKFISFDIIGRHKSSNREWILHFDTSKRLVLYLYDESANAYEAAYSSAFTSVDVGKWLHIVATYDGTGGTGASAGISISP